MNREPFEPYPGRIYTNRGSGARFLCIASGDDPFFAVMKNIVSGWIFEAHNIGIYDNGTIDWNCSKGGFFKEMTESEIQLVILDEVATTFSKEKQVDMMIEKMGELTKAFLDERRGRESNIAKELADVLIMAEQMKIIFNNAKSVEAYRQGKINHLATAIAAYHSAMHITGEKDAQDQRT